MIKLLVSKSLNRFVFLGVILQVEDEVEVEEDPQVWAGVVREERLLL